MVDKNLKSEWSMVYEDIIPNVVSIPLLEIFDVFALLFKTGY